MTSVARQAVHPLAAPTSRPAVASKVRIGPASDRLEFEADRIADAVIGGRPVESMSSAPAATAQRKCAACQAEDDRVVRRQTATGTACRAAGPDPATRAAAAVSRPGQPLSALERAYFEPRFGRDLTAVRLHADGETAAAARAIDARAFTLGNDIGFGAGEHRPETAPGRHLMAHELAHVAQQQAGAPARIRRATYGSGTPPVFADSTWAVAPQDEREHVDAAMARIDEVVSNPNTYAECHNQYREKCPGGTAGTLATVWNRARIWRITSPDPGTYARAPTGGSDIGYTPLGHGQGVVGLASTLMHEAGHNCGIPGNATHWHAELVSNYCMGPGQNEISLSGGPSLAGASPLVLLSYRRFLGDWAGGRMRATLGADLNLAGVIGEGATSFRPSAERPAAEYGSITGGVQARLGGWGGSRYGGFSFRVETGLGVGRFNLRPATPDEAPRTGIRPDFILQVGPRAEFLIKAGDAHVFPLSVGAAYRLAQPLNSDAEALHGLVFSLETRF